MEEGVPGGVGRARGVRVQQRQSRVLEPGSSGFIQRRRSGAQRQLLAENSRIFKKSASVCCWVLASGRANARWSPSRFPAGSSGKCRLF